MQFNEDITDSVLGQSGLQNIYGSVNNKGISLSSRHVKNRAIDSTPNVVERRVVGKGK